MKQRTVWYLSAAIAAASAACTAPPAPPTDAGDTGVRVDAVVNDVMIADVGTCVDMDNDGHPSAACGGDDCDDNNPRRNPSAREVCDSMGVDEDCNPCTLGEVVPSGRGGDSDRDEDGFPSRSCFNRIPMGAVPVCADTGVDGGVGDGGGDGGVDAIRRVSVSEGEVRGTDCDDSTRTRGPGVSEVCDPDLADENCNGLNNEGCECPVEGNTRLSRTCVDSIGGAALGACAAGMQQCSDGRWGMCSIQPVAEVCDAARVDEDCDGVVNEDCTCTPGESRTCADAMGVAQPGICGMGTQTCRVNGAMVEWGPCSISPQTEICDMARSDENCNGVANENCACYIGESRGCRNAAGVPLLGACRLGLQTCSANAMGSVWSACSVTPGVEVCDAGNVDEDCDGLNNEGCSCVSGTTQQYSPQTGRCIGSSRTCSGGMWGPYSYLPTPEVTCNTLDEDCNGPANDTPSGPCYSGPAGTLNRGICRGGTRMCSGARDVCAGETVPGSEVCDGVDNNCDGASDNIAARYCVFRSSRTTGAFFAGGSGGAGPNVSCRQDCDRCSSWTASCTPFAANLRNEVGSSPFLGHAIGSANGSGWRACGIIPGFPVLGQLTRRFSGGRYRVSAQATIDSANIRLEVYNTVTGAVISVASSSQGLGGQTRNLSGDVDFSPDFHTQDVAIRVLLQHGSNAFACSTLWFIQVERISTTFTMPASLTTL